MRVVLYARVSTEEQKSGFSISDQLRTLRDHARRSGLEVVEECVDDGYPGSDPDRPGLMRAMELAESGAVEGIVATKRDRLFRSRLYRLLMDRDLEEYGVSLVALNDTGHRIGDGIQDDFAEWEREQITQRTATGRREKAKQGKVIAGRLPDYGYRYGSARDSYEVAEEEMRIIRRILTSLAEGASVNGLVSALEADGIPAPNGGKWQRSFVRSCAFDDCYRPHDMEELRALGVAGDVLENLDPDSRYGVWWYNRRGVRTVRVSGAGGARKSRRIREKPRTEWIPVPVPHSGVSREVADQARVALQGNVKHSRSAGRDWPLSGGILRCPDCGRALVAVSTKKLQPDGTRKKHYYYRCATRRQRGLEACSFGRTPNADAIEEEVWQAVRSILLDPDLLRRMLRAYQEEQARSTLDPGKEAKRLAAVIAECECKRKKDQEMYRADAMTLDELRASLTSLKTVREEAEEALFVAEADRRRAEQAVAGGEDLLRQYEGFAPSDLDNLGGEARREVYNHLGISVVAAPSREEPIRVFFGASTGGLVWQQGRTSTKCVRKANRNRLTLTLLCFDGEVSAAFGTAS